MCYVPPPAVIIKPLQLIMRILIILIILLLMIIIIIQIQQYVIHTLIISISSNSYSLTISCVLLL